MTENNHQQPRALAPRKLEQTESLQTLNHWRTVVKNYFRRCQFYSFFLRPGLTWTSSGTRGFTINSETSGLKRSPEVLASDLEGFLSTIGTYLPFDYVTEKLLVETTNLESVWSIIYEIYDAELVTTNYLDYAFMTRESGETYRNFYNRLVGFTRQHLPQTRVSAEGVISPDGGEELTVGLLDSIAIHWLLSIDRRLINIIKTEFATQLKSKRLCEMIKPIATSIDELLARHDKKDQIVAIKSNNVSTSENNPAPQETYEENTSIETIVRRIERLEQDKSRGSNFQYRSKRNYPRKQDVCKHCQFINSQLHSNLDIRHSSKNCTKKKLAINIVEVHNESESDSDQTAYVDTGDKNQIAHIFKTTFLQNEDQQQSTNFTVNPSIPNFIEHQFNPIHMKCDVSESNSKDIFTQNSESENSSADDTGRLQNSVSLNENLSFTVDIKKIQTSQFNWNSIHKAKSPKIECKLKQVTFKALIDTGAEINVLDKNFAVANKIGINKTTETAHGASKLPLDVFGQTTMPVSFQCLTNTGLKTVHLGIMLVVVNLGVDCLIGEPGKALNNLVCLPRQKLVVFANETNDCHAKYVASKHPYVLARAVSDTMLFPGERLKFELPSDLKSFSHLAVSPRVESADWLKPEVIKPVDGHVFFTNSSPKVIRIKKSTHLADIRDTQSYKIPHQKQHPINSHNTDQFQFSKIAKIDEPPDKYLHLISVDPDNVLTEDQKEVFHKLNREFAHIFTPNPGRYNGSYGYIDNRLQFSAPPPPNSKTHIPNYAPKMNDLLAEKMDMLEEWGVLAEPEALGVSVEFVSPSLLVPKPEPNEFRVVTDFSSLNTYLKRVPNTSATIAQAKSRIARANFVIHLDFSNFFFQNGMQRQDICYLGTVHPYKGLRVYTCDPQGLKGASERSYEKLLRIFGDMIQNKRLAQMADGIHVLGNTVEELVKNYKEVLKRADACNFTFKPSKVIICPRNITLFGWNLRGNTWYAT